MRTLDFGSVRWGLLLALLSITMGIYLGLHIGKDEEKIEHYMHGKASASSTFQGDNEKVENAVSKGMKYLVRSHEHFQGLGTMTMVTLLLLAGSWLKPLFKSVLSITFGLGGFCYPLFWYLTAYKTAELGSGAAKESLALLAQFGAGLYALSALALFVTYLAYAVWGDKRPAFLNSLSE